MFKYKCRYIVKNNYEMDYFELLIGCGFSKKGAATYLALLEHGPLTLSKIGQHTHINRPALYTLLPKLIDSGVVSSHKKGKTVLYKAESPEKIEFLYEEKYKLVKEGITLLHADFDKNTKAKPTVQYFEGKRGISFIFDDVALTLPQGGMYYRYTSRISSSSKPRMDSLYYRKRDTKRIERMVITGEKKAKGKIPSLNRHVKTIPKKFDLFEDNVSLVLYGDKTAYIDYDTNTSVLIDSPKIAGFQKKLFNLLWRLLK